MTPRLFKELLLIVAIKLALIMVIRGIWFSDAPTVPVNGTQRVSEHLLGSHDAPSLYHHSRRQPG